MGYSQGQITEIKKKKNQDDDCIIKLQKRHNNKNAMGESYFGTDFNKTILKKTFLRQANLNMGWVLNGIKE